MIRVKTQFICLPNSIRSNYGPCSCEGTLLSDWTTTNQTQTDPPCLETKPLVVPSESRSLSQQLTQQSPSAALRSKLKPKKFQDPSSISLNIPSPSWRVSSALLLDPFCLTIELAPRDSDKVTLTCLGQMLPGKQIPRISCLIALNLHKNLCFSIVPLSCRHLSHKDTVLYLSHPSFCKAGAQKGLQ